MNITLIGAGMGTAGGLSTKALDALGKANVILGANRILEGLPDSLSAPREPIFLADAVLDYIQSHRALDNICIVYSGDTGFYSAATRLIPQLGGHTVEILPGTSSMQYLAAKLGIPWQDWHLLSAHGRELNLLGHVLSHEKCFFLLDMVMTPQRICEILTDAGIPDTLVTVGQRLSAPDEEVVTGPAFELMHRTFTSPAVVLTRRQTSTFCYDYRTTGIPDHSFIRGDVPMTKQEVRAVALAKLGVGENDICYDIGAGTGSVSVEMGLLARYGRVYAVEEKPEALALCEQNRRAFGVYNVAPVAGTAPDVLTGLPAPDAVFIGGSKGKLAAILDDVTGKNPKVRVVITAITPQTLTGALAELENRGFGNIELSQVSVSRGEKAGGSHLLKAQNPIFIVSGEGQGQ